MSYTLLALPHQFSLAILFKRLLKYYRQSIRLYPLLILLILLAFVSETPLAAAETLKLNLKSFSQAVIANNLQLQAARQNSSITYAAYEQQRASSYPSLISGDYQYNPLISGDIGGQLSSFNLSWNTNFISGTTLSIGMNNQVNETVSLASLTATTTSTNTIWSVGIPSITISQKLLNGGFIKGYNSKVLDTLLYTARAEDARYKLEVAATLLSALITYHRYMNTQALITLYERDLKDVTELFRFNRRKSRLGTLNERDLLSSEILTQETKRTLTSTKNTLAQLRTALFVYMGMKPKTNAAAATLVFTETLPLQHRKTAAEVLLPAALAAREDYQALQTSLISAQNELTVARLARLPSLDLSLSATLIGSGDTFTASYNNIAPSDINHYNVTVGLEFSAYTDSKWYKAQTQTAALSVKQLESQLQELQLNILQELQNNLIALSESRQLLTSSREILELTRKRYAAVSKDYKDGRVDFEINVAVKRELFRARTAYLNSKFSYESNLLNYQYLTGELNKLYNINALSHPALGE